MDLLANYDSSGSEEQQQLKTPRKLKSYTAEFKLKVVKYAKDFSKNKASIKYGVDRASVLDWVKHETKLHQIKQVFKNIFFRYVLIVYVKKLVASCTKFVQV